MNLNIIKSITETLLERDYSIIPQLCSSSAINDDSKYITLFKYSGTILYCLCLINTSADRDYIASCVRVREGFYKYALANKGRYGRAYFTAALIGSKEELKDFCTLDISDYTAFTLETRWIIDSSDSKIYVYGSQPDKIGGLKELLERALSSKSSENGDTDIAHLAQREAEKRRREIKSSNIALTLSFIAINCFMLALTYIMGGINTDTMLSLGAIEPSLLKEGQYYRLFNAMFLHWGIAHLLCNTLFLYVFGSDIEKYYGKLRLLIIYIGSGIAGNILFCLVSNGVAAGASGAVFGLYGAVLSFCLRTKRAIGGKDTYFMLMFVVISFMGGFLEIGVANSAHLGGFIFGFLSGLALYPKGSRAESAN